MTLTFIEAIGALVLLTLRLDKGTHSEKEQILCIASTTKSEVGRYIGKNKAVL